MPPNSKAKIDLAKIHGAKVLRKDGRTFIELTACQLYERKNGAIYLELALFETPADPYGNSHRITQDLAKPLRDAKAKGAILGNAKGTSYGQPGASSQPTAPKPAPAASDDAEDIPF